MELVVCLMYVMVGVIFIVCSLVDLITDDIHAANFCLQVKWRSARNDATNGGYSTDSLRHIFEKVSNVSF